MSWNRVNLIGLLILVVACSGIGVVYAKYATRRHFIELQHLQSEREQLDVEWGRLQLEESALATYPIIEKTAREQLGMQIPRIDEVVLIKQ